MNSAQRYILAILAATSCLVASKADSEVVDRIAALVNDKVITFREVVEESNARQAAAGLKKPGDKVVGSPSDADLGKTLDLMISELILDDEVKKRGIELTETELDGYIKNIMKQNGLKTYEELGSALALQGMTLPAYKKNLKKQIERSKLMNYAVRTKIDLSEQDLKNYYMQNMEEARDPDALHLKNIFISKNPKNPAAANAKAKAVLDGLKRNESFESLVKRYSEDSNAKSGGDLGFLTVKELNPKIYSEVSKLKPGQHTGVIDNDKGLYIIKLVATRRGEIKSFEEVKDELRNRLTAREMESKFDIWLSELKSQSYIDIKI